MNGNVETDMPAIAILGENCREKQIICVSAYCKVLIETVYIPSSVPQMVRPHAFCGPTDRGL